MASADVDSPSNLFVAQAATNTAYGSYALTTAGAWTYSLNNNALAIEALNVGDVLVDTFTITTVDGTQQSIAITINGRNDAAVISGTSSGVAVEAGGVSNGLLNTPVVTGTLSDTDVDNPLNTFIAQIGAASSFGSFGITANGAWTYTVDNTNAAVEALNAGDTLTDTVTVAAQDGTAQTITVTISGRNDNAVISNAISGMVTESGDPASGIPGVPVITGVLAAADTDNPSNVFVPVQKGVANFGTFQITGAGVWTYALDNSNPAVEGLANQGTLTDTFVVQSIDGTPQVISITIQGTSDLRPGGAGIQLTLGSALVDVPVANVQTFESASPGTQTTIDSGNARARLQIAPIGNLSDALGNVVFDDSADRRSLSAASRAALLRSNDGFSSRASLLGRQGDFAAELAGYDFGDYRFQLGRFTLVQQLSGRVANVAGLDTNTSDGGEKGGAGQEFTASTAAQAAGLSVALGIAAWALRSGGLVAAMLSSLPAWRQMDLLPVLGNSDGKPGAQLGEGAGSEAEREEQAVSRVLGGGGQSDRQVGEHED